MIIKILIGVLIFVTVIACLPSTFYSAMMYNILTRHKESCFEKRNLKNTPYAPFQNEIRESILEARSIPCEEVWINSSDGLRLFGRYYDRGSDKVMVFVHGYSTNSFNNFSAPLKAFLEEGYNVLMPDQRANGRSEGRFTTLSFREKDDLICWIDWLDKKPEVNSIYLYGISMGATTVAKASDTIRSGKVKRLVMESGFTSFYDQTRVGLKKNPDKSWSVKYMCAVSKKLLKIDLKESSAEHLSNNKIPALFLHAGNDTEVPIEFTKTNYEACASRKEMIVVEGAVHTTCFISGGEKLRHRIFRFLASDEN